MTLKHWEELTALSWPEWRPIKTLPRQGVAVLVTLVDGLGATWVETAKLYGAFVDGDSWTDIAGAPVRADVVAWMPLPPPAPVDKPCNDGSPPGLPCCEKCHRSGWVCDISPYTERPGRTLYCRACDLAWTLPAPDPDPTPNQEAPCKAEDMPMPICDTCKTNAAVVEIGPDTFGTEFHCRKCGESWAQST